MILNLWGRYPSEDISQWCQNGVACPFCEKNTHTKNHVIKEIGKSNLGRRAITEIIWVQNYFVYVKDIF